MVDDSIFYTQEEQEELYVQGKKAHTEEFYIATSLGRLRFSFVFQYSVLGGSGIRGGQIVDFLVYTHPLPTPIQLFGKHWHTGVREAESRWKLIQLERAMKGVWNPPEVIWDYEIPTQEKSDRIVAEKIGVST